MNDKVDRINKRSERLGRILTLGAKLCLFALLAGSLVFAALGITMDFDQPLPGTGIILTILTAIPAVLQAIDWLWPHAPIGKYRAAFERLKARIVRFEKRRELTALFARHGSEEIATRVLPPEEAKEFTVAAQMRRRRHRRWWVGGIGSTSIAGLSVYFFLLVPHPQNTRYP